MRDLHGVHRGLMGAAQYVFPGMDLYHIGLTQRIIAT